MTVTLTTPTHPSRSATPLARDLLDAATGTLHLLEVVRRVADDPTIWSPQVADVDELSPGGAPHRVRLPGDLGAEIWVVSWPTSWATQLHTHEESDSAFAAVRGTITEVRLDERQRLLPRAFRDGLVQHVPVGQAHDLRNERPEVAVTVHAYLAPARRPRPHAWRHRGGAARAFVPPTATIPAW